MNKVLVGEAGEDVRITRDEMVLGDDADRIAKIQKDFQTRSTQFELSFYGLVAIRVAREGDGLGDPGRLSKRLPEEERRISLYENLRFEVQAGGKAEELMTGPGITINASMLTPPVGIYAVSERHIGTVVFREYGLRSVHQETGGDP